MAFTGIDRLPADLRPVSAMPISNHASPALGDFGYLQEPAKSKASSDCFCRFALGSHAPCQLFHYVRNFFVNQVLAGRLDMPESGSELLRFKQTLA